MKVKMWKWIRTVDWSAGLIQQIGDRKDLVPSLTALQNLNYLERLDMEETKVSDAALEPLPNFQTLRYLSLRNGFLTDISLYRLSSIRELIILSIRDAVLTNAGLDSLNPPPTLKVLDLMGCWLITEDILSSFCHKHPQIEVKHELVSSLKSDQNGSKYSSPLRVSSENSQRKQNQSKHPIVGMNFACFTSLIDKSPILLAYFLKTLIST